MSTSTPRLDVEWVYRYALEHGQKPASADQLCSFVRNRGGKLPYALARDLMQRATSWDMPTPDTSGDVEVKLGSLDAFLLQYDGEQTFNDSGEPHTVEVPSGYQIGFGIMEHIATGISVHLPPLQVGPPSSHQKVLYHYTNADGKNKITGNKVLKYLKASYAERAHFGDGVYTSQKPPDRFGSKDAVLLNNYTNATDPETQLKHIEKWRMLGVVDFCIPIIVPRSLVVNVMAERTERMTATAHTARHCEPVRPDRDIWVIVLRDLEGDVTDALEDNSAPYKRHQSHDFSVRIDAVETLAGRAAIGDSQATEVVMSSFKDSDFNVRIAALWGIACAANLSVRESESRLTELAQNEANTYVLDAIKDALAFLGAGGVQNPISSMPRLADPYSLAASLRRPVASQPSAAVLHENGRAQAHHGEFGASDSQVPDRVAACSGQSRVLNDICIMRPNGQILDLDLTTAQDMSNLKDLVAQYLCVEVARVRLLSSDAELLDDAVDIANLAQARLTVVIMSDHASRMQTNSLCLLNADQANERYDAACSLCDLGKDVDLDEQACAALSKALTEDSSFAVRSAVLNGLRSLHENAAPVAPFLAKIMLRNESPECRRRAQEALNGALRSLVGCCCTEIISGLQFINHQHAVVASRAVEAFSADMFSDHVESAIPSLARVMTQARDVNLRSQAAKLLGHLSKRSECAAQHLADISLHSAKEHYRKHALQMLMGGGEVSAVGITILANNLKFQDRPLACKRLAEMIIVNAAATKDVLDLLGRQDEGFGIVQLRSAGFSGARLKEAGFSAQQMKDSGYTASQLKDVAYTSMELSAAGFTTAQLKNAGFTSAQLKNAGFSAKQLKEGLAASQIKDAVFSSIDMHEAGFSLTEMMDGGYSAAQLKDAGFTAKQLKKGFAASQIKDAGFSSIEMCEAGFSLTEMMDGGCTAAQLKDAGFSAKQLKEVFSPSQLKDAGFSLIEMCEAGFSLTEMVDEGYTAAQLKDVGFSAKQLRERFAPTQIKDAGFSSIEMCEAGFSLIEMMNEGFTAAQLRKAGFCAKKMKAAGFTAEQLKIAGYTSREFSAEGLTAAELKHVGLSAKQVKDAGFTAAQLKIAGYTSRELRAAGFTATELKDVGFSAKQMKEGGFTAFLIMEAGFSSPEMCEAGFSAIESYFYRLLN